MKIILLGDVKKVGVRGALVTVADGYAQNVLIPRKLALPATPQNILTWERAQEGKKEKEATDQASAATLLKELEGKNIELRARANPSGGLFEAIREKQIAEALQKQLGVSIPEDAITISEPIKKLGEFRVKVSIHGALAEIILRISSL